MRQRFLPGLACLWVASDCALRALGYLPSIVFASGFEWFWWFSAFVFAVNGIGLWIWGSEG